MVSGLDRRDNLYFPWPQPNLRLAAEKALASVPAERSDNAPFALGSLMPSSTSSQLGPLYPLGLFYQ